MTQVVASVAQPHSFTWQTNPMRCHVQDDPRICPLASRTLPVHGAPAMYGPPPLLGAPVAVPVGSHGPSATFLPLQGARPQFGTTFVLPSLRTTYGPALPMQLDGAVPAPGSIAVAAAAARMPSPLPVRRVPGGHTSILGAGVRREQSPLRVQVSGGGVRQLSRGSVTPTVPPASASRSSVAHHLRPTVHDNLSVPTAALAPRMLATAPLLAAAVVPGMHPWRTPAAPSVMHAVAWPAPASAATLRPVPVALAAQPALPWSRGEGAAASGDQMEGMADSVQGSKEHTALGMDMAECSKFVQAVSLGSYCGSKLSLRRMGFGEAHMPFDWMRTRVEGLLHWLQTDFDGFLNWSSRFDVTQSSQRMTIYRSAWSSFWHDNLDDEVGREKLYRRCQRFNDLVHDDRPALLFVRSAAGSEDLMHSESLLKVLQDKFQTPRRRVYLLVIAEDQPLVGPILHAVYPELLFWVQPRFTGTLTPYLDAPAPFEDAIAFAVQRILGDPRGIHPGGRPDAPAGRWPVVSNSTELLREDCPIRQAGFQDTSCGLWAGNLLLNGMSQEVMLAAFEGIDNFSTHSFSGKPPLTAIAPAMGGHAGAQMISVN